MTDLTYCQACGDVTHRERLCDACALSFAILAYRVDDEQLALNEFGRRAAHGEQTAMRLA